LICFVWPFFFSCHNHGGDLKISQGNKVRQEAHSKYNIFAVAEEVDLDTESNGRWSQPNESGRVEWSMQIKEEAASLNFGFREFVLPPSAKLLICDSANKNCQEFGATKSTKHHFEMWTPILKGGLAHFKLSLDQDERDLLRFRISTINKGLKREDVLRASSQDCLIDVLCADEFPQIENWNSEIQSVGLISIEGTRLCTGVLLNNVRQDFTPYFLTARHCGITAENAASVVVHWNYENTICRFGKENNENEGDGSLATFNSGATFLADLQRSDFTLLQLNEDVVDDANAYFAGWSASAESPIDVTTIHHANTEEKRITFGSGKTSITRHFGQDVDTKLDHIKVSSWEVSSTSGGSSGAPLFDANHRVVGQLHGGLAACGNEESDWFGRFHTSWEGDSIPERQLRAWLDPDGSGLQELDGVWNEIGQLALQISILQLNDLICAGDETASIQINIANGNGPFRYSIDGGENFQTENVFDDLGGGVYSVLVRDANDNTSAIVPFFISDPDEIQINFTQVYNQLSLEVIGGVAPYLFTYNGDITFDSTFNNVPQGNNTFSLIDANGCSVEASIELSYNEFQSQLEISKPISCHDAEDGEVVIQHTGTVGPYKYQLNNGPVSESNRFANLRPGNYSGRVIDSLGNIAVTVVIELAAPELLGADLLQVEENIIVQVNGGVAPYTFSYNNNKFVESNQFSVADGIGVIIVKDSNNCEIEIVNTITSLDTGVSQYELDLYPNPSTGIIWLKDAHNILNFLVINTQGKVVKSGKFSKNNSDVQFLEITNLGSGIYYFRANMRDGKAKVLKFIII